MDDDDYRAILAALESELEAIGASELADPKHYVKRNSETGEIWQLKPQAHLVEMLKAFDRHLAVLDRELFDRSIESINGGLEEGKMVGAVVVWINADGEEQVSSLNAAPELRALRDEVQALVEAVIETPIRRPEQ